MRWAWTVPFAHGLLMTLAGLGWLVTGAPFDRAPYERIAGVPWEELVSRLGAAGPVVTGALVRLLGGNLAFLAGCLVMAVSATALRRGERWARRVLWLLPLNALTDLAVLGWYGGMTPAAARWDVGLAVAVAAALWASARWPPTPLVKVISGGQTGVDQAALHAARARGLECGGWCPPERQSEAGRIPDDLPLEETPMERSLDAPDVPRSLRTEWNVRDSDATLVLRPREAHAVSPGTDWALRCAGRYGRGLLVCDPDDRRTPALVRAWLRASRIRTLNVAGPSEGEQAGIGERARRVLEKTFG